MRLFISHIHEERAIAQAIRDELTACFGAQVSVFLAEDIPLGTNWLDQIKVELGKSDVIVVLFSKHSIRRPWINIEAGYGVMAGKQVIPLCHSGFSKSNLPVIYGLLQAVDLVAAKDVNRLLDEIAHTTQAGQFLGDKDGAVTRWIERVSQGVLATPEVTSQLNDPPCVWVLGSSRQLPKTQTALNGRFVGLIAQAFIQRRFRIVFGRSRLLDALGGAVAAEIDRGQTYGIDHETLSEFASASAMHTDSENAAPNPVVLLGSFRSDRGLRQVFAESIGHMPDIAVVIGGTATGRTQEEIQKAKEAGIPVLPLRFTGGVAANSEASVDSRLNEIVTKVQETRRDYPSAAQLLCDVIEKQTLLRRDA